jgi:hypothetical protein
MNNNAASTQNLRIGRPLFIFNDESVPKTSVSEQLPLKTTTLPRFDCPAAAHKNL